RSIPAHYPAPLGVQILKADAHRQASMLRQEIASELLPLLGDAREPQLRQRLVRLVENQLRAGRASAQKAGDQWPHLQDVQERLTRATDLKPAAAKKHLK